MHPDRLRWLVNEHKYLTLDGAAEIARAAPDLLRQIESANSDAICEICLKPIATEPELIKGMDGCDFHRKCCDSPVPNGHQGGAT